ncbi:MAG TPA: diguanylate cyclase, partial [Pirellulaceae bacterium]|nr:diguanylate cyclase [Pirellulaceae bacterium]
FDVRQATDDRQALAAAQSARPDFLVLDTSHGDPVDLQLCRQVRRIWPQGYTFALLLAERPETADITTALEAGFDDFLTAPVVFGELLARLRAGARVIEFEQRLAEQSGLEPTTGLPDKGSLSTEFATRLQQATGAIGWLALFDIDYFFRFADQCGRPAAQAVLREAGQLIQQQLSPGGFVASLASDQIVILLPPGASEAIVVWADGALAKVAEHEYTLGGEKVALSASCGATEISPGESLDAVLVRAQKSLQFAKSSGRNCTATSQEVDREAEAWAAFAADGKLFQTTVARDVMQPCPLLLHVDETVDQASAFIQLTGLTVAPVVDGDGKLAGTVTLDQLAAARLRSDIKTRESGSVRLVRHVMSTDIVKFDETTSLGRLFEFFTGENAPLAIVVRDRCPRGIVHCQGLAALNEKLAAGYFAATKPRTNTSEDLLVPELAMAE